MNKDTAITQANLNRINQVTPQGSLTYSQDKNADGSLATNADGTAKYTQTQSLSADEQKKYDLNNQVAISLDGLANDNISRVADTQATPFTYDGMTPMQTSVQAGQLHGIADSGPIQKSLNYSGLTALPGTNDFSADATKVQNSVYDQAASRLNPQWQQNDSDMASKLAAQGISENSDAYRRAQDNEARSKNDAYNQAQYSAIQAGSAEQSRLFGLAMSARQQGQNEVDTQGDYANSSQGQQFSQNSASAAMDNQNQTTAFNEGSANAALANSSRQSQIEQAAYLRNMPINDIAALLGTGSGVASPDFTSVPQVGVSGVDYMGAVQNQYQAQLQQYNAQQSARSSALGSIFGAAGTAGAAFLSDMRFKDNIKRIGTLANGIATYAFKYVGHSAQHFGVMAQEVLGVIPEAVSRNENGTMFVDYGRVYA